MIAAQDMAPAPAASATDSARVHVARLATVWGVAPTKLPVLASVGEVPVRGGTIVRLAQQIDGLPVWGGELHLLVRAGGELHTASGTLLASDTPHAPARFVHDRAAAIARAANGVGIERAIAQAVWYPSGKGLVAAWVVDAYTNDGNAQRTVVAGDDGRVLARHSLMADAFTYSVYAETAGEKHPFDGPIADATPHPTGIPDRSYPAYLAGPSLVTIDGLDPWLPADATETTGNNVDAYVDLNSPSGLTSGDFRATITAPSTFGYTYNTSQGPLDNSQQQMAAVTSLFYILNWLHDYWYPAGFTEAAGNAQASNYGRGGVEGDALLAEAQDNALGGSRNNANMSTPMDGLPPRMQVYVWNGHDERSLTMTPSGRTPDANTAVFGPMDFDVTGAMVIGTDGEGMNPTDGCTAVPTCTGKVVVVDRGNCTFKTKALNIQNAGGVGMVLVNNTTSTSPPQMGEDPTITTPITVAMLSVTDAEGARIKQDIAAGTVTATLHRVHAPDLEGSLDATLVAHEFGHYLHHRLSLCENTMCRAISEGWGDFSSLLLMARAGDNLDGAYPFSVYVTQGYTLDPGYFGIRRAPYSVDMNINAMSYRHMADGEPLPTHPLVPSNTNSEVHNAGEVWAAAMWEGYVALQKAGTSFNEVRSTMMSYVVAGLLLAPAEASPMEARDAILQAALASSPADHDLLLAAFARRGFGSCAIAPPPESNNFVELVESTLVAGKAQLGAFTLDDACDHDGILDNGETSHLKIKLANQGHAALSDLTITVTSQTPGVTIVSPPIALASLAAAQETELDVEARLEGTADAIAGDLTVSVTASGGCESTLTMPIALRLNVDEKPDSSATDSFDTTESNWTPWTAAWNHVRENALDGMWHGDDMAEPSDVRLSSPELIASDTEPVVMTFSHRYSFEYMTGIAWDGGVVEYSIDDGITWIDVATVADAGYTDPITNQTGNVLADRMAYAGASAGYPDFTTTRIDLGTALAGLPFRVRFRIGTDAGTGAEGWDIDDVSFTGIVNTPFPSQVADDGACEDVVPDPEDPLVSGGGGCCGVGSSESAFFSVVLLALLRRRRGRSTRRA